MIQGPVIVSISFKILPVSSVPRPIHRSSVLNMLCELGLNLRIECAGVGRSGCILGLTTGP